MPDEYYTRSDLAVKFVQIISQRWQAQDVLFVEPSAGEGAFVQPLLKLSRKVRALDINPKVRTKVIKVGDFLKPNHLFKGKHAAIVVIGNPPFGKNASQAVKFFNKAAKYADEIAFVLPRSFRKASIQNRLHPYFHLLKDDDMPASAFIKDGNPYDVPCAWQLWRRKDFQRQPQQVPDISHLVQFTTPTQADFAMRRVGYSAGKVITANIASLSKNTHYFLQEKQNGIIDLLRQIDWLEVVSQTVGPRSLARDEFAHKLHEAYFSSLASENYYEYSAEEWVVPQAEFPNVQVFNLKRLTDNEHRRPGK